MLSFHHTFSFIQSNLNCTFFLMIIVVAVWITIAHTLYVWCSLYMGINKYLNVKNGAICTMLFFLRISIFFYWFPSKITHIYTYIWISLLNQYFLPYYHTKWAGINLSIRKAHDGWVYTSIDTLIKCHSAFAAFCYQNRKCLN